MSCTSDAITSLFQSTLPREERHYVAELLIKLHQFQSTLPREERPSDADCRQLLFYISIHAPTRGATDSLKCDSIGLLISIHAPTRGATASPQFRRFHLSYFNPRSHERSDRGLLGRMPLDCNFNPRSHERSDSNIAQKICLFLYNTDNKYIIR